MQKTFFFFMLVITFVPAQVVSVSPAPGDYTLTPLAEIRGGEMFGAVVDQQTSAVYMSGNRGVWKSTDLGQTWANIGGGGDGVLVNPNNPSIMYSLKSDRVLKTVDGGKTWNDILSGKTYGAAVISPANPDVIYLGGAGGTVTVTRDGGNTWTSSTIPVAKGIDDMDIHPTNSNEVYASYETDGVWKSTDGGKTWVQLYNGQSRSLAIAPSRPATIYTSRAVSHDGGKTWLSLPINPAWAIAVHPTNPNVAYYASLETVWVTTNGRDFLMASGIGKNYEASEMEAVAIDAKNDMVYIGGNRIYPFKGALSGKLRIQPSDRGFHAIDFRDAEATKWATWLSSETPGVYIIENNGANFRVSVMGLEARNSIRKINPSQTNPLIAYGGHESGLFKTTDGGKTWFSVTSGNFPNPLVSYLDHNIVYYSEDDLTGEKEDGDVYQQVYKSIDGGLSWRKLSFAGELQMFHPTDPNILYGMVKTEKTPTPQDGLYKSSDGGETWTFLSPGFVLRLKYINTLNPDLMFTSDQTKGLWKSTDGGKNWAKVSNYPGREPRRIIELADQSLWVADTDPRGKGGIYRTFDWGISWERITTIPIHILALDPWEPSSLFGLDYESVYWIHPKNIGRPQPKLEEVNPNPSQATIQISSCQLLDRSNTVYELTQDVTAPPKGSCFLMPQYLHDITIDGKGHTVSYSTHAIFVDDIENFVIKDLNAVQTARGFGGAGVHATNGRNVKIMNVNLKTFGNSDSISGINLEGVLSNNLVIENSVVTVGKSADMAMKVNGFATIRNNQILAAQDSPGLIVSVSPNSVIDGNTIGGDGNPGIQIAASDGIKVLNNKLSGRAQLEISRTNNGEIKNNELSLALGLDTSIHSMIIEESKLNLIKDNRITGGFRGSSRILLKNSSENQIGGNIIEGGSPPADLNILGIRLEKSDKNTLKSNTITTKGKSPVGVSLFQSNENTIANNAIGASGSNASGIIVDDAQSNVLYNNILDAATYVKIVATKPNTWNTKKQLGTNIVGGPFLGGNFYAKGISESCGDGDNDLLCDSAQQFDVNNIDYLPLMNISGSGLALNPVLPTTHMFLDKLEPLVLQGANFSTQDKFTLRLKQETAAKLSKQNIFPKNSSTIEITFSSQELSLLPVGFYTIELERVADQLKLSHQHPFLLTRVGDLCSSESAQDKAKHPQEPRDSKIDLTDVSCLLSLWGTNNAQADINPGPNGVSRGKVDLYDANKLMANWTG